MINLSSKKNIEKVVNYVEEVLDERLTTMEAEDFINFFNSLIEEDVVVSVNRAASWQRGD